jgi:hypothetical protein
VIDCAERRAKGKVGPLPDSQTSHLRYGQPAQSPPSDPPQTAIPDNSTSTAHRVVRCERRPMAKRKD